MNIALSDVKSLSLNLPEAGVGSELKTDNFQSLMQKSLDGDTESTLQVIENTDLSSVSEMTGSDLPESAIMPAAWLEHLASAEVEVTTEAGMGPGTKAEQVLAVNAEATISPLLSVVSALQTAGEILPSSGMGLPSADVKLNQLALGETDLQRLTQGQGSAKMMLNADDNLLDNKLQPETGITLTLQSKTVPGMETSTKNQQFDDLIETSTGKTLDNLQQQPAASELVGLRYNTTALNPLNPAVNQLAATSPLTGAVADAGRMFIAVPANPQQWGEGIGDRVTWMVNQKLNSATIRLDPPSLGRLDIQIQISDDITQVSINTQHAQTRDLVDNASLRLKEFLQEAGYNNVNVDVSQQEHQRETSDQNQVASMSGSDEGSASMDDDSKSNGSVSGRVMSSDSLVDYYA